MGKFQLADCGTLLLDEIGAIDPEGQAKFLRVLEDGVVPSQSRKAAFSIDVRVEATMSMEVNEAMDSGRLHGDLFHRPNQVSPRLLLLRERPDDILSLFEESCANSSARPRFAGSNPLRGICCCSTPGRAMSASCAIWSRA